MDFKEVLDKRRSMRTYDPEKKVSREEVEKLIIAAGMAPTWKNSQTGRYYVIMSEKMLKTFKMDCLAEFNAKNCADAPVVIVTTFVKNCSGFTREGVAENNMGNCWGAYDLGLQNENLVLAASDMGLDTLIMGIRHEDKIRNMLDIPDTEEIASVISVGYGMAQPVAPKRKEISEISKFF